MCLKKTLTQLTALLCGVVLLFSAAVTAVSSKTVTESALEQLIEEYEGTYWTTDGSPSDSSGTTSQYYYGIQCKGFANYFFYRLFGVTFIGRYDEDYYYLPNPSGAVELAREWDFASDDTQLMQQIFAQARPGDFIQGRSRSGSYGHTMIYLSQDETGITVFDCNWDNHCGVAVRTMSWERLASYFRGLSLYTAENYSTEQADVTAPVISQVQTVLQEDGYTVTCTITDDVGVARVYFPSWYAGQSPGESAVWYPVESEDQQYSLFIPYQKDESGNPVYGTYYTHIYAYDAAGNYSVVGVNVERTLPEDDSQLPDASLNLDINGDGTANVLDVMALAQHVAADAPFQQSWDFSSDGRLNVMDVMALAQKIVFPIQ